MNKLLLGDEAVALGAINAGLSGVYAYPGTPSTEITEFIQLDPTAKERGIHSRWCTNEKTAMEAGLGMSYAGKRALVCMKHVGMNVCADAFINSAMTGVNGGLVVVAADDPSMHSSQNEQDSRFYGKFAMVPIMEPSDQQEAYDMMADAFRLSEELGTPVMLRLVTRLAHSRSSVRIGDTADENALSPSSGNGWVLIPANARKQYEKLLNKQDDMQAKSLGSRYNSLTLKGRKGIIACGIAYNYVNENLSDRQDEFSTLKISHYPLPEKMIAELAGHCDSILVVEDGQPVVENDVKAFLGKGYPLEGRLTGALPRTGELTPDCVGKAMGCTCTSDFEKPGFVAPRPPQLCPGCGHRDVYTALKEIMKEYPQCRIFGDIGCYALGTLPPFEAMESCVDMGASITLAKGAADAGLFPSMAFIGDSTFTHSGMTGLLDAVNSNSNITVIISDNLTTAMTGGQDSAGTNKFEAICAAIGVAPEHIRNIVPIPANHDEMVKIIKEEINYNGVSVIIPRRECIQTLRRHAAKK